MYMKRKENEMKLRYQTQPPYSTYNYKCHFTHRLGRLRRPSRSLRSFWRPVSLREPVHQTGIYKIQYMSAKILQRHVHIWQVRGLNSTSAPTPHIPQLPLMSHMFYTILAFYPHQLHHPQLAVPIPILPSIYRTIYHSLQIYERNVPYPIY